jgi:hypothetical protein
MQFLALQSVSYSKVSGEGFSPAVDTKKIDPGLGVRSYIESDAGSKSVAASTLQRHLRDAAFTVKSPWLCLFATGGSREKRSFRARLPFWRLHRTMQWFLSDQLIHFY